MGLDLSQADLLLDPADPSTLFPPPVQLIVAGDRIQKHQRRSTWTGQGYGLKLDDNNEVHSFPALDGDTLRLGVRERAGRPMLVHRHQFIGSEGYEYQPGLRNTSTGPNTDRLFHDGTRTRYNCIPENASDPIAWSNSFGDNTGSRVVMGTYFQVPDWVFANDLQACILGMHAPAGGPASPFTNMVGQGKWRIVHRNSRKALKSGAKPPAGRDAAVVHFSTSDVGTLWGAVIEFVHDPVDGWFNCWVNPNGKGWKQIVSAAEGWGWGYGPKDPDRAIWHAVLNGFYSWHRAGSAVAEHNWDPRHPLREIAYGPSILFIDPAPSVTAASVGEWINSRIGTTSEPEPDPGPAPRPPHNEIDRDIEALTNRVAKLERRFDRMREREKQEAGRWEGLRATLASLLDDW